MAWLAWIAPIPLLVLARQDASLQRRCLLLLATLLATQSNWEYFSSAMPWVSGWELGQPGLFTAGVSALPAGCLAIWHSGPGVSPDSACFCRSLRDSRSPVPAIHWPARSFSSVLAAGWGQFRLARSQSVSVLPVGLASIDEAITARLAAEEGAWRHRTLMLTVLERLPSTVSKTSTLPLPASELGMRTLA